MYVRHTLEDHVIITDPWGPEAESTLRRKRPNP